MCLTWSGRRTRHSFAFDKRIALTADPVSIRATAVSALPTKSRTSYLPSVERLFRGDPVRRPEGLLNRLRHPKNQQIFRGPRKPYSLEFRGYETLAFMYRYCNVHLRVHVTSGGIRGSADRRDPSFAPHRLWRIVDL